MNTMRTQHFFQKVVCAVARVVPGLVFLMLARNSSANPTGLTVVSGTATTQTSGSQLTITTSQSAYLNWSSFNIGSGEKTIFNQPSSTSVVFNRITDQNPSLIYGSLQANGVVLLLNSSGFYFGPNSYVSAAGLVVSTANCVPPANAGGTWEFNGPPPLASIVNYGQIKIGNGGDCFFIADKTENHGTVEADGGNILFAAGQTVTMSERPDGRGMSMKVTLPQGSVDNYGNIIADGGTIALNAKVVNQSGLIQANSVRNDNGVIELVAGDTLSLGANSLISANGDSSTAGSAGGDITLKSGNLFQDAKGSVISVTGGSQSGNGGAVEISAPKMSQINSKIDGSAQPGSKGGSLLLDPDFIVLDQSDFTDGSGALHLNVNSDFVGLSTISLQALYDITFADGIAWDLSGTTGQTSGQLTLEAGRNIIFGNTTALTDGNNWSVALYAGVTDFATPTVTPGAGSIYFNAFDPNNPGNQFDPSGYIQMTGGSVNLVAGQDITVGTGRVITTGGGSIMAHALSGNIDTGGYGVGFIFQNGDTASQGYYVDQTRFVGGISTAGGGDVTLIAGGNVSSVLPTRGGYIYDGSTISSASVGNGDNDAVTAGAGAYSAGGSQPGNVTIIAGGNVTGHYVVSDGIGTVYAGAQMDANGNPIANGAGGYLLGANGSAGTDTANPDFALSLINGGWNVAAAQNIILQEVRNPNGVFNNLVGSPSGAFHNFDYGAADYVDLNAGNLVQLGSPSVLPRTVGDATKVPVIYPGILNIVAGAGGVDLVGSSSFNSLTLFPSALGSLTINTTDGGSLVGSLPAANGTPQIFNLIMSDSGGTQYNPRPGATVPFGLSDHAGTPVHLGSETPFDLNISGDMDYILVGAPEAAHITVGGNMNNCRFQGMNLSASDTTSINVTGDINNRGAFTTVDLSTVPGAGTPDLSLINQAIPAPGDPSVATLLSSFSYNAANHTLTFQAIPNLTIPAANFPLGIHDPVTYLFYRLQHLTIQVYVNGQAQWQDPPFNTIPKTEVVSVLDAASANALLAQYNALGTPPSGAFGYAIGGGGTFQINAHNMDLGTTAGIQSYGAGFYNVHGAYPLAQVSDTGANILVDLTGTLSMFSTAISSLNGGNIYVNADGDVNVGSSDFTVTALGARGIYSIGQGDVSVFAGGNVNVEGSRIAVYDTRPFDPNLLTPSGAMTVVSRNGNVNVGSGGSGFSVVNSFYVDPVTKQVTVYNPTIPGSGILQTSYNQTGNSLVEALNGSVIIGAGGVEQLLFKGNSTGIDLNALSTLFRLALEGNDAAALAYQKALNGLTAGAFNPFIDVYAGYGLEALDAHNHPILDAFGNPIITAANRNSGTLIQTGSGNDNINASGSGIVGAGTATLKAAGGITGNIISFGDVNLSAVNNINVTVFGLGTVSVASSGGSISGTIIGVGGINASGGSIDANLESNSGISGGTSGSSGFAASGTAGNIAAGANNASNNQTPDKTAGNSNDDELNKKKKGIALAQKVSRVTVILPKKN